MEFVKWLKLKDDIDNKIKVKLNGLFKKGNAVINENHIKFDENRDAMLSLTTNTVPGNFLNSNSNKSIYVISFIDDENVAIEYYISNSGTVRFVINLKTNEVRDLPALYTVAGTNYLMMCADETLYLISPYTSSYYNYLYKYNLSDNTVTTIVSAMNRDILDSYYYNYRQAFFKWGNYYYTIYNTSSSKTGHFSRYSSIEPPVSNSFTMQKDSNDTIDNMYNFIYTIYNDDVYIFGGYDNKSNSVRKISNSATPYIETIADDITPVAFTSSNSVAFVLNNKIYIGYNGFASLYEYNVDSSTFTLVKTTTKPFDLFSNSFINNMPHQYNGGCRMIDNIFMNTGLIGNVTYGTAVVFGMTSDLDPLYTASSILTETYPSSQTSSAGYSIARRMMQYENKLIFIGVDGCLYDVYETNNKHYKFIKKIPNKRVATILNNTVPDYRMTSSSSGSSKYADYIYPLCIKDDRFYYVYAKNGTTTLDNYSSVIYSSSIGENPEYRLESNNYVDSSLARYQRDDVYEPFICFVYDGYIYFAVVNKLYRLNEDSKYIEEVLSLNSITSTNYNMYFDSYNSANNGSLQNFDMVLFENDIYAIKSFYLSYYSPSSNQYAYKVGFEIFKKEPDSFNFSKIVTHFHDDISIGVTSLYQSYRFVIYDGELYIFCLMGQPTSANGYSSKFTNMEIYKIVDDKIINVVVDDMPYDTFIRYSIIRNINGEVYIMGRVTGSPNDIRKIKFSSNNVNEIDTRNIKILLH